MSIIKFLGDLAGWKNAIEVILAIISVFYKDLVDFITKAVGAWNDIIDATEDLELKEAVKEQASADVDRQALEMFSSSPPYAWKWLVRAVKELVVGKLKLEKKRDQDRKKFEKMLQLHPVSSRTIDDIKNEMPEAIRDLLFPEG